MQFLPEWTKHLDERGFHKVMHVFRAGTIEPLRLSGRAFFDPLQRRVDLLAFRGRKDSGAFQRARPRAVELQLVRKQPAIKPEGTFELIKLPVRVLLESPAPHLFLRGFAQCAASLLAGMVIGSAKRLMKPSASLGL